MRQSRVRYVFKVKPSRHALERIGIAFNSHLSHRLRVSTDDSKVVAQTTIAALLDIMEEKTLKTKPSKLPKSKEEFFNHCLVCRDGDRLAWFGGKCQNKMGFLMTNGLKPKNILPSNLT